MIKNLYVLALLALVACSGAESNSPIVIGHRGVRGHEMENTLSSIQKAIDMGVDAIEVDVYTLTDGEVIIYHDQTTKRLTDYNVRIESLSLAALDTIKLHGGYSIPTLKQSLDLINHQVIYNIELKGSGTAVPTNAIIEEYKATKGWKDSDFIISSFKWDELAIMHKLNPNIPIALLVGGKDLDKAFAEAKKIGATAINPHYSALDAENTKQMHDAGLKIYPWTVNDTTTIRQMKELGVDGIITDYPERVNLNTAE